MSTIRMLFFSVNDWKQKPASAFFWQISCKDSLAYYLPYKGFCVLFLSCGWFMGFAPWIGFDVPENSFSVVSAGQAFLAGMLFSCKLNQIPECYHIHYLMNVALPRQKCTVFWFCSCRYQKISFLKNIPREYLGTFQKKMNSSLEDCGEDRGIGLKEVTFFYILFFKIICSNVYLYYRSLEVKLPYDPQFLSIGWLVGWTVGLSVIIS